MLPPRGSAWSRAPILVGWALGLACFVYLMALAPTLNTADESFILYEAKRVYQGQALYRDFFDFLRPGRSISTRWRTRSAASRSRVLARPPRSCMR